MVPLYWNGNLPCIPTIKVFAYTVAESLLTNVGEIGHPFIGCNCLYRRKKLFCKHSIGIVGIKWPRNIKFFGLFEHTINRFLRDITTISNEFEEWYDQLGGGASPLADAIIDRIAHDSYRINITSIDSEYDISMREVYGLDKALRE